MVGCGGVGRADAVARWPVAERAAAAMLALVEFVCAAVASELHQQGLAGALIVGAVAV